MSTRMTVALDGDEAAVARESGRRVSSHLGNGGVKLATLSIDGETVPLPLSAMPLLAALLDELGQGHGVALAPVGATVTVEQAGEMLDATTESVGRMVAAGEIEGGAGKLLLHSVLHKQRRMKEARLAVLAEMAALDQEWGMP